MRRFVTKDITLHDGTQLPEGSAIGISTSLMSDPAVYENPEKFDGYRFLKLAQKNQQSRNCSFVATSREHLAFGLGQHACPGRFFAANALKIALCHLLLKYEWKLLDGSKPRVWSSGYSRTSDPTMKIMIRRRTEEDFLFEMEM
jgi:cytochrome P450